MANVSVDSTPLAGIDIDKFLANCYKQFTGNLLMSISNSKI